jgi:GNAT superfamily N-acetyltransferase
MHITYKTSTSPRTIKNASQSCLSHRLFVNKWALCELLRHPVGISRLVLAYNEKTPIGVGVLTGRNISFFVRKAYRRKGIATQLFKKLSIPIESVSYDFGIFGSDKFFASLT